MYNSSPISSGRSAGLEGANGYVATAKAIRGRGCQGIEGAIAEKKHTDAAGSLSTSALGPARDRGRGKAPGPVLQGCVEWQVALGG
jgi:hypothetical protein